jgi:hypothetical protein
MFGLGVPELLVMLLFVILVGLPIIFWLNCIIDIVKNEFHGSNKIIWLVLVICIPLLGMILYYMVGKKQKIQSGAVQAPLTPYDGAFCPECGVKAESLAKFCTQCGTARTA